MVKASIGIIGLGKMGGNLALQAMEKGYKVVGYDKYTNKDMLEHEGIIITSGLEELVQQLAPPRVIFMYVPAGATVDLLLGQLAGIAQAGDILVDGGNSYWRDSIIRSQRLKAQGLHFVDCGTSGGMDGARNGACFMAGGDAEAITKISPILKDLAVENGFVHTGAAGSGHFVKLVHNGIEFGMLQAIGEGLDLLTRFRDPLNIPDILHTWNHGSVIRGWLIDLLARVYNETKGFDSVPAYIEDTGEVNWLVNDAMRMEVPIPVIAQSVMQLFASRDTENTWAKAIAMMRHGFGGHPFGEHDGIKHERQFGRIEDAESNWMYRHDKKA